MGTGKTLAKRNHKGAYGVDHPNVAYVVHLDSPMSMTEFTQGSGRGGRGSDTALSLTIVPYKKKAPAKADENCEGKQAMLHWLATPHCRRVPQSEFLDGSKQDCQDVNGLYCDNCLHLPGQKPAEETRWNNILGQMCKFCVFFIIIIMLMINLGKPYQPLGGIHHSKALVTPVAMIPPPKPILQPKQTLAHSPLRHVSAAIQQQQLHAQTAKQRLQAALPAVSNSARRLTRMGMCLRCSLSGHDNEHGWAECPHLGRNELMWKEKNPESDIRDWIHQYLSPLIDDEPGNDSCCLVCFFAREDKRFHNLDDWECLFPDLVGKLCYIAYFYPGVRLELCRKNGHQKLVDSGEDFIGWAAEKMGEDHRWLKGATKVVCHACEIIDSKQAKLYTV